MAKQGFWSRLLKGRQPEEVQAENTSEPTGNAHGWKTPYATPEARADLRARSEQYRASQSRSGRGSQSRSTRPPREVRNEPVVDPMLTVYPYLGTTYSESDNTQHHGHSHGGSTPDQSPSPTPDQSSSPAPDPTPGSTQHYSPPSYDPSPAPSSYDSSPSYDSGSSSSFDSGSSFGGF